MSKITNNIGLLRKDLIANGWHMTAFPFNYKHVSYDVLFENNDNLNERVNKYASVTLHFIDTRDINRAYTVEANQIKMFHKDISEFRAFFGVSYVPNLGDILQQFYDLFVNNVPSKVPAQLNIRQNNLIDQYLASRGGHNPNAIYCYDARRLGMRNGKQMFRSIFIDNLTLRRKPILYKYFKDEKTVTFYYSDNPNDELDDTEIISKFTHRESL